MNIPAQVLGIFGFVFFMISFQFKKKATILELQTVSYVIYMVQFLILEAYTGMVVLAVSLLRNLVIYIYDKKEEEVTAFVRIIFYIAFAVSAIVTYDTIVDILPAIALILSTYMLARSSTKMIRIGGCVSCVLWMVYDGFVGAYVNILAEGITVISGLVRIYKT